RTIVVRVNRACAVSPGFYALDLAGKDRLLLVSQVFDLSRRWHAELLGDHSRVRVGIVALKHRILAIVRWCVPRHQLVDGVIGEALDECDDRVESCSLVGEDSEAAIALAWKSTVFLGPFAFCDVAGVVVDPGIDSAAPDFIGVDDVGLAADFYNVAGFKGWRVERAGAGGRVTRCAERLRGLIAGCAFTGVLV